MKYTKFNLQAMVSAIDDLHAIFPWIDSEEGANYWYDVVEKLRAHRDKAIIQLDRERLKQEDFEAFVERARKRQIVELIAVLKAVLEIKRSEEVVAERFEEIHQEPVKLLAKPTSLGDLLRAKLNLPHAEVKRSVRPTEESSEAAALRQRLNNIGKV